MGEQIQFIKFILICPLYIFQALSMHSHAFKAMFHQEFVEKNKQEIELQDVKHEVGILAE